MVVMWLRLLCVGRRASEEHIAKSELLVNTAQKPNTVYVGDSSGEDSMYKPFL